MDNLTHSLTALALSRAGLNRFSPRATLILIVAANLPDIDIVSGILGPITYLDYHRGLTHSLALLPLMALFPALLAMGLARSRAGFLGAYLLSLIGVASHLLLDWTNSYGIRLLLPFSGEWLHADLNAIVDVWLWAFLLLAFLGPLLGRLVSSEIGAKPGSGQGLAIFALSCFLIYDYGRYLAHQRALAALDSRIYDGVSSRRVAAFPDMFSPLKWTGWVETETSFLRFDMNQLFPFDPAASTRVYKPASPAFIDMVRGNETFRVFRKFAIYPMWSVSPAAEPEGATQVELRDQRFPFVATAVISGQSVKVSFHF